MTHQRSALTVLAAALLWTTAWTAVRAQQAPPAPGDEAQLIAVLQQADAPLFDKAKACQALATVGTKKCVPVLAGLLGDEKLSHYARFGLEPIPDPAVDKALRAAMRKLKGMLLVGVIDSIGVRRDAGAVDDLTKWLDLDNVLANPDPQVAAAAAAALGRIADEASVETLTKALAGPATLRPAAGDACLSACDMLLKDGKRDAAVALYDAVRKADVPKHVKIAATGGAIRSRGADGLPLVAELLGSPDKDLFAVALGAAHQLPAAQVTPILTARIAKWDLSDAMAEHPREARIMRVLGEVGDAGALPTLLTAAQKAPWDVRLAAVEGLARLGDAKAVPVLLEAARQAGPTGVAAREGLAQLEGDAVDAAITAALEKSQGTERAMWIELVGQRGIASAVPALFAAADSDDAAIRQAAVAALGVTVGLDKLNTLIDRLLAPKYAADAQSTMEALKRAVLRMPDRDATAAKLLARIDGVSPEARDRLFELVGTVGGAKALAGVAEAAASEDEALQDVATRVLGEWTTPDAAPVLLKLAGTPGKFQVRALRGYIRIARQLGLPDEEKLAMCRKAMEVATRDDEKLLVVEVLPRIPSAGAIRMAVEYLDDPALRQKAAATAVAMGEKLIKDDPAAVADAMQKVAAAPIGKALARRADALAQRAKSQAGN